MRVSLDWLKDWVEIAGEPRELADRLTMAGLEVEAIEAAAPPLASVVVGAVVSCAHHPNADTLSVCQVSTGGSPMQIVCGAPNVHRHEGCRGDDRPRLPGGVEIRAASLRGVDSNGMLCSGAAPASATERRHPRPAVRSRDRRSIDAGTQARRHDTHGQRDAESQRLHERARHRARGCGDVAPGSAQVSTPAASVRADASVPVELTAGAGCERFVSRVIRDVRADAASPAWLQERLRRAGLRPINAIVDVTNYVMLDVGQPMLPTTSTRSIAASSCAARGPASRSSCWMDAASSWTRTCS
jgi:phenylalanyl-tRNA synthetase beta chain